MVKVNRFETPIQQQYVSQYVPFPVEVFANKLNQLQKKSDTAKSALEKAESELLKIEAAPYHDTEVLKKKEQEYNIKFESAFNKFLGTPQGIKEAKNLIRELQNDQELLKIKKGKKLWDLRQARIKDLENRVKYSEANDLTGILKENIYIKDNDKFYADLITEQDAVIPENLDIREAMKNIVKDMKASTFTTSRGETYKTYDLFRDVTSLPAKDIKGVLDNFKDTFLTTPVGKQLIREARLEAYNKEGAKGLAKFNTDEGTYNKYVLEKFGEYANSVVEEKQQYSEKTRFIRNTAAAERVRQSIKREEEGKPTILPVIRKFNLAGEDYNSILEKANTDYTIKSILTQAQEKAAQDLELNSADLEKFEKLQDPKYTNLLGTIIKKFVGENDINAITKEINETLGEDFNFTLTPDEVKDIIAKVSGQGTFSQKAMDILFNSVNLTPLGQSVTITNLANQFLMRKLLPDKEQQFIDKTMEYLETDAFSSGKMFIQTDSKALTGIRNLVKSLDITELFSDNLTEDEKTDLNNALLNPLQVTLIDDNNSGFSLRVAYKSGEERKLFEKTLSSDVYTESFGGNNALQQLVTSITGSEQVTNSLLENNKVSKLIPTAIKTEHLNENANFFFNLENQNRDITREALEYMDNETITAQKRGTLKNFGRVKQDDGTEAIYLNSKPIKLRDYIIALQEYFVNAYFESNALQEDIDKAVKTATLEALSIFAPDKAMDFVNNNRVTFNDNEILRINPAINLNLKEYIKILNISNYGNLNKEQ